ncbi:hypothetical protein ACHAWX_001568 [Stephanocyclus meneghinianus]
MYRSQQSGRWGHIAKKLKGKNAQSNDFEIRHQRCKKGQVNYGLTWLNIHDIGMVTCQKY